MIANYPSNTAYAWWLMEHFWALIADMYVINGQRAFLAFPEINTPPAIAEKSPIEVLELVFPWKNRREREIFIDYIKLNNIKMVYLTDQPFFDVRYKLLRDAGVTHIIVHDHTPGDRPPSLGIKGAMKALRNRISLFTANSVFCLSPLMRERSISNGRIPPSKCSIVQNGIPPHHSLVDREQVRRSLGIDEEAIVAITTGRAHPYKRFDLIIKAASLQTKESNITFIMVGDGPVLSELKDLVKALKVEKSVKLLGFRTDIKDLLGASDFAIHAALGEGFSLSIAEYMGAALPVLVPDIPSVSQAIEHGSNGYIYSKDSCEELYGYALKLAESPSLRNGMGEKSKVKVLAKYSLEQCSKDFIAAIGKTLKEI